MNNRFFLFFSTLPFFLLVYFLQPVFIRIFKVENTGFVMDFYYFITGVSLFMLFNVIVVFYVKRKLTGYVFLIWTMLKIMLVMAYFIIFVLHPKVSIDNSVVFAIMATYFLYLIYEVIFGVLLLNKPSQK